MNCLEHYGTWWNYGFHWVSILSISFSVSTRSRHLQLSAKSTFWDHLSSVAGFICVDTFGLKTSRWLWFLNSTQCVTGWWWLTYCKSPQSLQIPCPTTDIILAKKSTCARTFTYNQEISSPYKVPIAHKQWSSKTSVYRVPAWEMNRIWYVGYAIRYAEYAGYTATVCFRNLICQTWGWSTWPRAAIPRADPCQNTLSLPSNRTVFAACEAK